MTEYYFCTKHVDFAEYCEPVMLSLPGSNCFFTGRWCPKEFIDGYLVTGINEIDITALLLQGCVKISPKPSANNIWIVSTTEFSIMLSMWETTI